MPWNRDTAPFRKRVKRDNTPNHAHFLTFSCFRRQPFLSRDRTREWLVDGITAARTKHAFRLIAYVFMPEHVHLLIFPTAAIYSVPAILASIKIPVGRKARNFVLSQAPAFARQMRADDGIGRATLRFWQAGGGYDRNIYLREEFAEKINYIHQNPVARGLVILPEDWKWSSAADYARIRLGPLPVDSMPHS